MVKGCTNCEKIFRNDEDGKCPECNHTQILTFKEALYFAGEYLRLQKDISIEQIQEEFE